MIVLSKGLNDVKPCNDWLNDANAPSSLFSIGSKYFDELSTGESVIKMTLPVLMYAIGIANTASLPFCIID